ncbi:MAG TPA: hypothetical protein PK344_16980 [Syntrophorhabdaceae bacterium]|nr:hypothetical protein [Syntrophorhabdaceae bacterium]
MERAVVLIVGTDGEASVYPARPIITDIQYPQEVVKAMQSFKAKMSFRLKPEERFRAMRDLVAELSGVYGIEPTVVKTADLGGRKGLYRNGVIYLEKLSVITLLHEFAHAVFGTSEYKAVEWSVNLFRKVYPEQFEKLEPKGHTLVKKG